MQQNFPKDQALVKSLLADEETAYALLLQKYLKPIYNFLFRLTNDQSCLDDLAQETFIKAWKNLRHFDQSKKFKTWLFVIAKNTAFDYLKKKKAIPFSFFEDEKNLNMLENIKEDQLLPDEILQQKDIAQELEQKIKGLPELYRIILMLHYKEDFSLREISQIFGQPYNTIKNRHYRALLKLKNILGKKEIAPDNGSRS